MPAKSKAQVRALAAKMRRGEITKRQFDEFVKGVDVKKLPERVKKRRKKRR